MSIITADTLDRLTPPEQITGAVTATTITPLAALLPEEVEARFPGLPLRRLGTVAGLRSVPCLGSLALARAGIEAPRRSSRELVAAVIEELARGTVTTGADAFEVYRARRAFAPRPLGDDAEAAADHDAAAETWLHQAAAAMAGHPNADELGPACGRGVLVVSLRRLHEPAGTLLGVPVAWHRLGAAGQALRFEVDPFPGNGTVRSGSRWPGVWSRVARLWALSEWANLRWASRALDGRGEIVSLTDRRAWSVAREHGQPVLAYELDLADGVARLDLPGLDHENVGAIFDAPTACTRCGYNDDTVRACAVLRGRG